LERTKGGGFDSGRERRFRAHVCGETLEDLGQRLNRLRIVRNRQSMAGDQGLRCAIGQRRGSRWAVQFGPARGRKFNRNKRRLEVANGRSQPIESAIRAIVSGLFPYNARSDCFPTKIVVTVCNAPRPLYSAPPIADLEIANQLSSTGK
jgi:hypothetical protein